MNTTYFIDSENVGSNWFRLLEISDQTDEVIIFYTDKSHMSYKDAIFLKETKKTITFIECFTGPNALDFQLCTELGFRVNGINDREFVIFSDDKGFDAAVKYWQKRGIAVRRLSWKESGSV